MQEFSAHSVSMTCCDEQLLLHPSKTVYWPAQKTLLAADVHIGKEHTFARAGIPVPGGISEQTLHLLMQTVDNSSAERLIVLGDLLHATPVQSESWQACLLALLAQRTELQVQVIIGNHDSKAARSQVSAPLDWHSTLYEPPFLFTHEPAPAPNSYVIAGHIHPAYQLKTGRRSRLRCPIFWFRREYAVLPAFGEFTGGYIIEREATDRVFMVGDGATVEV